MAAQESNAPETGQPELPVVLLHRFQSFNLSSKFKHRLLSHCRLLDPAAADEPAASFLAAHAGSVRVLLCVGFTPVTAEILQLLPALELVVCSSVGVDHVELPECRRRGIAVTNASTAFSEDAADYAVGLLIDVLRRVSAADRYVRAGLWPAKGEHALGSKVGGKHIGVVGLGSIGSLIAKRLEAFGFCIAYTSRKKRPSVLFQYYADVHDLAANSDALIVCCPLTDETHHIINKDVMTLLGKKGVIINIGRGGLIDEKELVNFLVQGELGGAGLDVFENEPAVPKELYTLENVVLSPHKAIFTPESFAASQEMIVRNLEAFFSNKPLLSKMKYDE